MVFTFCAPNCKGNYKTGPKVSLFRFPKDNELKQRWLNFIKREKEFTPTDSHRVCVFALNINRNVCVLFLFNHCGVNFQVCELHFKLDDIIREEVLFDRQKNVSYVNKLSRPVLKEGVIPSILPNCPKYLSNSTETRENVFEHVSKREEELVEAACAASLNTKRDYETNISFSNFEEFKDNINRNERLFNEDRSWSMQYYEKEIIFMNFELHPIPKIRCSTCGA